MEPIVKTYYDSLAEGKILGKKCPECGAVEWPPIPTCTNCSNMDLSWVEITGEATLDSLVPIPPYYVGDFGKFAPLYVFNGKLSEGTEISNVIIGLDDKGYEKQAKRIADGETVTAQATIIDMGEFKSVAFKIKE